MNKKAAMKNGMLWFLLIGIVLLIGVGAYVEKHYSVLPESFAISSGTSVVYSDCASALSSLYKGAQPGECVASGLNTNKWMMVNAPQYLYYIESAVDGQAGGCLGSGISPACPLGYRPKCTITISHDYADTLNCKNTTSTWGTMDCVGGYCTYRDSPPVPDGCTPIPDCEVSGVNGNTCAGNCLTLSSTTYVICLPSGKYSGILNGACPATVLEQNQGTQNTTNTNTGSNTNTNSNSGTDINGVGTDTNTTPFDLNKVVFTIGTFGITWLYLIIAVIGLIILLVLIGKKK